MKKVLFVCSMGMSSAIAVNSLKNEAGKKGYAVEVNSIGASSVEDHLAENHYDLIMVAPQIKHRFRDIEPLAQEHSIPCVVIQPRAYGPLGGPFILKQVLEQISLEGQDA